MALQDNYGQLSPDRVIDAVESTGFSSDSRILALNSYENRVYQVGLEDGQALVAKFYRPHRWTDEQILEEHQFTLELCALDIPVVPPIAFDAGTLLEHQGYRFALYERRGGHAPELDNGNHLEVIGRFMGRIHAASRHRIFQHRPAIDIQSYANDSRDYLLSHDFVPAELIPAYDTITRDIIKHIEHSFAATEYASIRLHGDCHPGNILWRDEHAHFVDFDDARNGPAVQDLWMLLSGEHAQRCIQLGDIMEGYSDFNDFAPKELHLIEPLRAMRLMHYAAWLARRWTDPAFPRNFPWFNTQRYWAEHVLSLREQLAALDEPVLQWL
ncbi:MAG: serine/threonine protein kinase [Pseudomonadota bacterium]